MILKQIKVKIQMTKLTKSQFDIYQMVNYPFVRYMAKTMVCLSFLLAEAHPLILKW